MRTKFWAAYLFGTVLILFGAYAVKGADPIVLSDADMQGINGALQYYRCDGEPGCNTSGCVNVFYFSSIHSRWECDWTGSSSDRCTQSDDGDVCKGEEHFFTQCYGPVVGTTYFTGYYNCESD